MTYKRVFLGFYLMAIPLSILIFCDVQILQNKLYTILHILLICTYFITFYLVIKLNQHQHQNQPIETEAEIESNLITIPSAPIIACETV
jgi:hypothetical protein